MKIIGKSIKEHYILWTVILIIVTFALLRLLRKLPIGLLNSYLVTEVVVAAIVLFCLYCINGTRELKFSTLGLGYAFKLAWWPLLLALVLSGFGLIGYAVDGMPLLGNPILIVFECAVLSILVGLFEETLFRGFVLSCFLETRGDTFKGIFISCIISSILFGFLHVYSDFLEIFLNFNSTSMMALFQVFGKTLSTGMFGFILAVIYLRTKNLWNVAILHAINDFGPFIVNFLYLNNNIVRNYVDTTGSPTSFVTSVEYIIEFILTLPAAYYAYKQLKLVKLPQLGLFKQEWAPEKVSK